MMNMAKLGTVLQAAKSFESTGNPMNTGLHAIHYAYFRGTHRLPPSGCSGLRFSLYWSLPYPANANYSPATTQTMNSASAQSMI